MRVLTLHWWWIPTFLVEHPKAKRTENRPVPFPDLLEGETVAFHAGASKGQAVDLAGRTQVYQLCQDIGLPLTWDDLDRAPTSAIVFTAVVTGSDLEKHTPFDFDGSHHWRLEDVRKLTQPIPYKGGLGLRHLPVDVEDLVRARTP